MRINTTKLIWRAVICVLISALPTLPVSLCANYKRVSTKGKKGKNIKSTERRCERREKDKD